MKESQSLDVSYFNAMFGKSEDIPDLPSWTPEWRYCTRPDKDQKSWHLEHPKYDNPCRALGNGVLELRGFTLGVVEDFLPDAYARLKFETMQHVQRTVKNVPQEFIPIDIVKFPRLHRLLATSKDRIRDQVFGHAIDTGLRSMSSDALKALRYNGAVDVMTRDGSDDADKLAKMESNERCEEHTVRIMPKSAVSHSARC